MAKKKIEKLTDYEVVLICATVKIFTQLEGASPDPLGEAIGIAFQLVEKVLERTRAEE